MANQREPLGKILEDRGLVTADQIKRALEKQMTEDVRIGEAMVDLGYVSSKDVISALGEQLDYEVVELDELEIPLEAIHAIESDVARKHKIMPISQEDGVLTIALSDPLDFVVMDELRFMLNTEVRCVLSDAQSIDRAIDKYYGGTEESTVDNLLADWTATEFTSADFAVEDDEAEDDDAPIIRLVQLLIGEAVRARASDIHVEPLENRLRVRYRIDGVCKEIDAPPKRLQGAIISRIKIMAGMDIAEKRRPQDGRIPITINNKPLDLRVSALPAQHGESIVMRLLEKESILINLQELGFHEADYKRFLSIIKRPNGIFLVTGPTGSGKTTTLYAALNELNRPDKKIITAEDPVEYNLAGVNQCEVLESVGRTFAIILRSMLRQAPNIILVGEIRDKETAEIAIQAALTGHLVFSTLHTNDAPSAITRLIDMGVKPFLVASSTQAIMAQRLVRVICPKCKVPARHDPTELRVLGLDPDEIKDVTLYEGKGCNYCSHTGFRGRSGIFELIQMSPQLREMAFRTEALSKIRREARRSGGMLTLAEDGARKVLAGITTPQEVIQITQQTEEEFE